VKWFLNNFEIATEENVVAVPALYKLFNEEILNPKDLIDIAHFGIAARNVFPEVSTTRMRSKE